MGQADVRVSDAERFAALSALGEHLSTGRLDIAEYDERCGLATLARTRGQLEALFYDLPTPHPDLSAATRPARRPAAKQCVSRKEDLSTPASQAFGLIGGMSVVFGVPAAIVLTIIAGAWWMFMVVPSIMFTAGGLSEAFKKKPAAGA